MTLENQISRRRFVAAADSLGVALAFGMGCEPVPSKPWRIEGKPLEEVGGWLEGYRRFWETLF